MKIAIIIILYVIVTIPSIISLKNKNKNKEIKIFSVLIATGLILSLLITLGVDIPSVDEIVGDLVLSMLGE